MCGVMSLRWHPIVDGSSVACLRGVRGHIFSMHPDLGQGRHTHSMGRPQQEGADIKKTMPPKLQMPLLDSGSLIAKPRIAPACERNGQIDRHGGLLWRT
jgi:hypothetical protein